MERADIKIGFGCNNHCKFCVQGGKRDYCFYKEKSEILDNMKKAVKKGKEEVVFTGGEPCLHPDILDLVKMAREVGFKEVQMQTNGRMFAYSGFCLDLIRAGVTQFGPSLHGHNAETHDFLTDAKGSFNQTTEGIRNLRSLGQFVLTNSVITSTNAKHLPDLARLLVRLGVDQFQFAFIHLGGTAYKNKDWIIPKKSEIMPYIKKGLDIGIRAGKKVMTEAIPFCLMDGYEDYIAENIMPLSMVFDAGFFVEEYHAYRKDKGKTRGPECHKCKYYKVCEGPWKEYPEIYGWAEFKPVN